MPEAHPVDVVADDLIDVYRAGARRLEALVRAALRRGLDPSRVGTGEQRRGDATTAYRARQLAAARALLRDLEREAARQAPRLTRHAYTSAILAIDHVIDPGDSEDPALRAAGRFGGIHQGQVSVIAGNLERSLTQAAGTVGANLAVVFARADALEALEPGGMLADTRFIGRRQDDTWRRLALEVIGQGGVTLETRQQVSAELARRLIDDGVTDALTGFVDRSGRRWPLEVYTEMVARTTTREAASRAVVARLGERGEDTIAISKHPHKADVCTPYDGRTFALPGTDAASRLPTLDRLPPFHPRCRHVAGPGRGLLDAFEEELGIRADQAAGKPSPRAAKRDAPVERIRTVIDEQTERRRREVYAQTLEAELHRTAPSYQQAARTFRAWQDNDLERLEPFERDLLALIERDSARLKEVRAMGGGAFLDEAGITKIGKAVRTLAARRRAAATKDALAELEAARQAEEDFMMRPARPASVEEENAWAAEAERLYAATRDAQDRVIEADREGLRDVLAAVRPGFGEGTLTANVTNAFGQAEEDELTGDLSAALRYLPREWLEASDRLGPLEVRASTERAHYSRTGYLRVKPGARSTMLHELGHRMEHALDHLRHRQSEFYRRRTTDRKGKQEPLKQLSDLVRNSGYTDNEVARPDKFTNAYSGKDYGGQFYEILTMGLEGIFHRRHGIRDRFTGEDVDRDYVEFILGLLAAA